MVLNLCTSPDDDMMIISAHHLMMVYICTKFQEKISKGFRVIESLLFVY